jgi:hypothetical protein
MRNRLAAIAVLVLASTAAAASAEVRDLGSPCLGLNGTYTFVGESMSPSKEHYLGMRPNIGLLIYPHHQIAFDERISKYKVVIQQGRPILELHGKEGPIGRLDMLSEGDFAYCLDDELTIERQRRSMAGSVYNYSRHRHRLRKSPAGDLVVETDVTGKFRTWLSTWERTPEHYAARFAHARLPR